jgi:hypothetical protein
MQNDLRICSVSCYPKGMSTLTAVPSTAESPFVTYVTAHGYRVALYRLPLATVPADFFADPDGAWSHEALVSAAGFDAADGVAVGALRQPFNGHPDGAAVVTLNAETRPHLAIIECPIAYGVVADVALSAVTAA